MGLEAEIDVISNVNSILLMTKSARSSDLTNSGNIQGEKNTTKYRAVMETGLEENRADVVNLTARPRTPKE